MRIRNITIRTYSFVRHCGRKMNKKCSRWPEHLSDKGIIPRTGIESESFHISTYAKDLYNTTKNDRITYINDPLTTSTTISKSIYILTMPLEQEIPNLKLIKTVKAEQSTIGTVWGRHLLMSDTHWVSNLDSFETEQGIRMLSINGTIRVPVMSGKFSMTLWSNSVAFWKLFSNKGDFYSVTLMLKVKL